jgi:hypothetical protein
VRAGRGRLAVGVLALVVAAAATVAAVVLFVRPAAEHRDGFTTLPDEVAEYWWEDTQSAPDHPWSMTTIGPLERTPAPTPRPLDEIEAEFGFALLRPNSAEFELARGNALLPPAQRVDETSALLARVRHWYAPSDGSRGRQVVLTQQRADEVPPTPLPFADTASIGEFTVFVFDERWPVRGRFETGASVSDGVVIAIVDAPDRETLVRFIESLSFGEGAAD